MRQENRAPLLPNLATRVDRYWKDESESESTCKYIEEEYTIPENCSELVVPKINREVFTWLQPYQRRQEFKYMGMQETLLCAVTAVAKMANLALEANNTSDPIDTTELATHALNAVTLLGNVQRKLNHKRKELLAPTLPKETWEVCSPNREVMSLLCDDWAKAVREAKEVASLNSILAGGSKSYEKHYARQQQGYVKQQRNYEGNHSNSQKQDFHQGRRPLYRQKKNPRF